MKFLERILDKRLRERVENKLGEKQLCITEKDEGPLMGCSHYGN